jgi:hypothetical protein
LLNAIVSPLRRSIKLTDSWSPCFKKKSRRLPQSIESEKKRKDEILGEEVDGQKEGQAACSGADGAVFMSLMTLIDFS